MTFTSTQLSNAFAVAHKYIEKNIPLVFAMEHPLLKKIIDKKQYAEGERLQFPINFNPMQNISYITGTSADVLNTNTQQNLTYGELAWKMWSEGFSVTEEELVKASGTNAVVDIVMAKAENTLEAHKDFLHRGLFGSAASAPLALNGFLDIFAASGTAYAGLTDTDFGNDVAGDNLWLPTIDTTTHFCSYSKISPYITKIKAKDANAIDYIISTPAVYQRYKDLQQTAGQRYVGEKDLQSGFDGIMIDFVPFIPDAYCQGTGSGTNDSYLYGVSSKTMGLKYKHGWDKPSPNSDKNGVVLPNQPIIFRKNLYAANLYCNNRRLNFVLKALDPGATS